MHSFVIFVSFTNLGREMSFEIWSVSAREITLPQSIANRGIWKDPG